MNLELNSKLLAAMTVDLQEYLTVCKTCLVRNQHMSEFNAEAWEPTKEELWLLDLLIGHIIGKVAVSYEGGDRLGDVADALCRCARDFIAQRPEKAPHKELVDAALVGFFNFWAGKRCMDLGLYAKDLYA